MMEGIANREATYLMRMAQEWTCLTFAFSIVMVFEIVIAFVRALEGNRTDRIE